MNEVDHRHTGSGRGGCYLGEVTSVNDPDSLSRVQVKLFGLDDDAQTSGLLWARVAVPFAGSSRGAFFLPDVGDEVLISFVNNDERLPVVVGGLWNGSASPPETLGGGGTAIDRWTIVGKAGTRIAIIEESSGQPTIKLSTPGGNSVTITDDSGGKIEAKVAGTSIVIDTSNVKIVAPSKLEIQAGQIEMTAGKVNVDAAIAMFSGVVKSSVLQSTTVVGSTYTPGAGNVW
jgi:uncharacterized protein involved in type VI secretion and phage assembly